MQCRTTTRAGSAPRRARLLVAWMIALLPIVVTTTAATTIATIASVADATPAAAAIDHPTGIDVSNYQHPNGAAINWSAVAGSGISFAFIKATEGPISCSGSLYTNSYFASDWSAAGKAGLYRGAYHFARPGSVASAITQAHQFAAVVGPMNGPHDLPPVLDLEVTCDLSPSAIAAWSHAWIDEVARLTGRHAIITTYPSFWSTSMAGNASFANQPLWIATYGPAPIVPPAWPYWTFWQSSSTATVPGINGAVDFDHFCCGAAGLDRLAAEQQHNPFGRVDEMTPGYGTLRVGGWDLDLDSFTSIDTHIYVDGVGRANVPANLVRPDIKADWPAWGDKHGFSTTIGPLPAGNHQVCVYGISVGVGSNTLLECRTVTVLSPDPRGVVEQVTTGIRSVTMSGWVLDPESSASNEVIATIDGIEAGRIDATLARPDVERVYAANGPAHGFSLPITLPTGGRHRLCVIGTNIAGYGTDTTLDCRDINLPTGSPIGVIEDAHGEPGQIKVGGWTMDPDTATSIPTHIYVDGVGRIFSAAGARPDIANAFPGYGPAHGIAASFTGLAPGAHSVCVYGIESGGTGVNTLLSCRTVTVPGGSPRGAVDSIVGGPGLLHVRGWTLDPDTTASIPTHIYVDGVGRAFTAGADRPDIANAFVGYGAAHGIDAVFTGVTPGQHAVCVYGIEIAGGGSHTLLTCQAVTVPGGSPFGVLDGVAGGHGSVRVTGWAIDPDTSAPVPVHVYVDGIGRIFSAGSARPDVGAFYPDWGNSHGMDLTYGGLTAGQHTVCTYAINAAGTGDHSLLGCRVVSVT
jgi:GH25 family lysozyme M1 (1,4-beta-N-acetylmuramidase)